ncbi:cytochrome B [Alsobacter soli]|uniref:Cytochrome B n=1 Tax=Alsobacter soli TaxID=2109933 RepID=A0A2T1HXH4_9HYPH|nr:cytochrome b/b6 domain-containing protein [Alsobacter soli]PSC06314.1 cytochrome B [Alsobacter soli]
MAAIGEAAQAGGVKPPATATPKVVQVWDPFVRVFHWSLVGLFALAFVTGDEIEGVHVAAGYAVAGLVGLRVLWGVVGSRHARFGDFVRSPASVLAYCRAVAAGKAPRFLGHNPAGGAMIVALLTMLAGISATGFMMTTDSFWGSEWVEDLHAALVYATLGLIGLHVSGVVLSGLAHRENLVKAMITGRKRAL